ncbi:protein kinase [Leifsonia shinshuensis]|uniref:non-specific serine/threonine protein kinase n=2 Tax=Leifsonia shinshuensis TaxID=150026 RepID=A0A7G6YGD6_9MICO|nr:protein kinase [Leifsonia shinshuensis]
MASTPPELAGLHFIRLLGSGGFSDVFLYEQELPKRSVAVKVLLTDSVDEAARARFVTEANVMARLSAHPFIATIFDAGVSGDDRPYLVMEYCSGPSLADRLKRERIPVEDALRTGVRLSSAVATAHDAGILHRDIKPANVLTNAFGWPALTDFGIASALEELPVHTATLSELRRAGSDTATSGSRSVGLSVPWSPPEMFADDPDPDVRSDIFSLAATLHTLLAGRTPFEVPGRSNGTLDLIGRIERGMITPLDRPDLPPSLTAVLRTGMAPRRENRYGSAVEFARALQRVELELGLSPTSIDVPNLHIATDHVGVAEGAGEAGDAGATRARSVATVVAQPVRPKAAPEPDPQAQPAPEAAPTAEPTRIRGIAPVSPVAGVPAPVESTVLRPAPVAVAPEAEPESDRGRQPENAPRRRLLTWIAAGAAAVVVIAVGAAIVSNALTPAAPATNRQGGDDGVVPVTVVPQPTLVSAKRDAAATSATIVWKTAQPKSGDQYSWVREGTTDAPAVTSDTTVTLTGLTPGVPVCVDVTTIRAGRTSQPLKACSS